MKRCILIGASPCTEIEIIKRLYHDGDYVICADGGYLFAEKSGICPDLIVGDFDSSNCPENCKSEIIRLPVKKDDTDMFYAVKEGIRRGCDVFLIFGATGGRLDHTYANFCVLKYLADREIPACIVDGRNEISVLSAPPFKKGNNEQIIVMRDKVKWGFGIFPFGCESCRISLCGFEYNADNIEIKADFPIGASNRIEEKTAEVHVHDGCAVVILEKP